MESIWKFLNSSFFVAVITLFVGLVAYWLYRKKNQDFKKDAANILLLEIQNAERLLKVAKERMQKDGVVADNAYLMPTESWSKYKYMFVRDFDRDEWDIINSFFDKCSLYDDAVKHKSNAFQKNENEIRANMHRVTADYVRDFTNKEKNGKDDKAKADLIKEIDAFQNEYLGLPNDLTLYTPQKPITDAKLLLESITDNMSQTSIGSKLKKFAGQK